MHLEAAISDNGVRVVQVDDAGGRTVKNTDVASFIRTLGNQVSLDTGFLDPKAVRFARQGNVVHIICMDPSQRRTIAWRGRGGGGREYEVFTPPTLFHLFFAATARGDGYVLNNTRLFCYNGDPLISDNTRLFIFPWSNTGENGYVCWGNSDVRTITYQFHNGPSDIINAWWRASFNTDMDHGRRTHDQLQRLAVQVEEGTITTYPVESLSPHRSVHTAGDIIRDGASGNR